MGWLAVSAALLWVAQEPAGETVDETGEIEEIEIEELEELEPTAGWYGEAYPEAERVLDLLTARPARPGSFVIVIAHRNRQPIADDPFHSFLGFDGGGLKIGLGLRYGVIDDLDLGVYRLNGTIEVFDTYELDARYRLLRQANHGIDLALRAGLSWYSQTDRDDALGGFGQLLVDRIFADRVLVGGAVMFHSDSSNDRKMPSDSGYSLAVGGYVEVRLLDGLAWDFETALNLTGYASKYPTMSTAAKLYTNRHSFAITLSNTQYMAADGIVTNTRRGSLDKWVLGFNITREI